MKQRLSHFHDFKVSGLWWLPNKPEVTFYGTLSYNPKEDSGINILIYNDLGKGNKLSFELGEKIPILLGFADGKIYTCVSLNHTGESHKNNSGIYYHELHFRVGYVVQGKHIEEQNPTFETLIFESAGIKEYLAPHLDNKKILSSKGKEYDVLPFDSIEIGHLTVRRRNPWKSERHQFLVECHADVQLNSKENPQPFEWFYTQAHSFKLLVDLLSGHIAPIEFIFVQEEEIFPVLLSGIFDVERVNNAGFAHRAKRELIFFKTIEGQFSKIAEKWLNIDDELRAIYHQLYLIIKGNYVFFEDRFFNLAKGLEILHGLKNPNFQRPKGEKSLLYARYLDLLRENHEKYPSLDRFNTHEWNKQLLQSKTLEEIAEEIRVFRNQFNHPLDDITGKPKPKKEMPAFLEQRLRALIYVIVFDDLGVPENIINDVIRMHTGY